MDSKQLKDTVKGLMSKPIEIQRILINGRYNWVFLLQLLWVILGFGRVNFTIG